MTDPKLLLFDIDGTLLLGKGVPRQVFLEVIRKRYPGFSRDQSLRFSGMTDPQIVHELLSTNGYGTHLNPTLVQEIIDEFIELLAERMDRKNPPEILPGVRTLLEYCESRQDCYLGLVTGNVMQGARIKLTSADLYHHFAVGAFGCDHIDRNQLPPIAIGRAVQYFDQSFDTDRIWIIGDSVKDVICAKSNDLKCLAVSTGFTSEEKLRAEYPDHLLTDLTDLDRISEIIGLS